MLDNSQASGFGRNQLSSDWLPGSHCPSTEGTLKLGQARLNGPIYLILSEFSSSLNSSKQDSL